MSVVAKRLDGLRCYLVWRLSSAQATLCYLIIYVREVIYKHFIDENAEKFCNPTVGFQIEGAMTPKVSVYPPPSGKQQFVR